MKSVFYHCVGRRMISNLNVIMRVSDCMSPIVLELAALLGISNLFWSFVIFSDNHIVDLRGCDITSFPRKFTEN